MSRRRFSLSRPSAGEGIRAALASILLLLAPASARAAEDYCAYGRQTAVLLVDRTTRFDNTDRSVFLEALSAFVATLGAGDRLAVFTMTGAYTDSRKMFERCKPGCPEEGFFQDLFATCRPVLARAQYREFTTELAAAIANLLRAPEDTPASDLFRTVAEITSSYAAADQRARPLRRLILFSDLIENSPVLAERDFRRLSPADIARRLDAAGLRASVEGAAIRVFGFGRDDTPARTPLPQDQRRRIEAAWRDWFRVGGASDVQIGFR